MEQRIQNLEEEVKLLKNQIRSVLLDIKENLAGGDWQIAPGNKKAADPFEETSQQPSEGKKTDSASDSKPIVKGLSIPASVTSNTGCDGGPLEEEKGLRHTLVRAVEVDTNQGYKDNNGDRGNNGHQPAVNTLEPLTLVMLLQWIERTQSTLGKEQTERLVEIYTNTGKVSEEARQTLQLLMGLQQKDRDNKAVAETIPCLIELDQLLRYQDDPGIMRNAVLKLLLKKGDR